MLFFSDMFGAGSSLQMHCPYQILSLFLKRYLTYCPLPPQTCASFPSFPPYTLCLSHPSFPLVFLTFLRSIEYLETELIFYFFGPCVKWNLSSLNRDRTRVPCIARWILNHWTTRAVPITCILNLLYTTHNFLI